MNTGVQNIKPTVSVNSIYKLKTCCNMLGAVKLLIGTTNIREVRHRINRINTLSHSEGS